jgi:hypothetical protein
MTIINQKREGGLDLHFWPFSTDPTGIGAPDLMNALRNSPSLSPPFASMCIDAEMAPEDSPALYIHLVKLEGTAGEKKVRTWSLSPDRLQIRRCICESTEKPGVLIQSGPLERMKRAKRAMGVRSWRPKLPTPAARTSLLAKNPKVTDQQKFLAVATKHHLTYQRLCGSSSRI